MFKYKNSKNIVRNIEFGIIASENNACKAYLHYLLVNDFIPSQVIYLEQRNNNNSLSRKSLQNRIVDLKIFIRRIFRLDPILDLFEFWNLKELFKKRIDKIIDQRVGEEIIKNSNSYPDFSIATKEYLSKNKINFTELACGINDIILINKIKELPIKYFLFAGDGRLREILNHGKKFIHIHPGIVPEVKGSDGILYSAMLRQKIGMSIFFMNEGIDTGDIVKTKEYSLLKIKFPFYFKFNSEAVKRGVINYIDPCYRAQLLIEVLKTSENPSAWNYEIQNPLEGKNYYFMHKAIVKKAVRCFEKK